MKTYRVTIKYTSGENTALISTAVPAYNSDQAIETIESGIDGKVLSKKAELLK